MTQDIEKGKSTHAHLILLLFSTEIISSINCIHVSSYVTWLLDTHWTDHKIMCSASAQQTKCCTTKLQKKHILNAVARSMTELKFVKHDLFSTIYPHHLHELGNVYNSHVYIMNIPGRLYLDCLSSINL